MPQVSWFVRDIYILRGTFSVGGQANCTPCAINTFAKDPGSKECTPCPPGMYAEFGAEECKPRPSKYNITEKLIHRVYTTRLLFLLHTMQKRNSNTKICLVAT